MSKSRKRNIDQIHDLKRENKELNETIRKLERRLNNQTKVEKTTKAKPPLVPKDPATCLECNKGKIEVIDLGVRKMLVCNLGCGYRKVIKNG